MPQSPSNPIIVIGVDSFNKNSSPIDENDLKQWQSICKMNEKNSSVVVDECSEIERKREKTPAKEIPITTKKRPIQSEKKS